MPNPLSDFRVCGEKLLLSAAADIIEAVNAVMVAACGNDKRFVIFRERFSN